MRKVFSVIAAAALFALLPITQAFADTSSVSGSFATSFRVSQNAFNFYYVQGSGAPTNQSATFTNTTNAPISYIISIPNQPQWLNTRYTASILTAYPGQDNGLGASVDPTGLAVGTYSTTILITGTPNGGTLAFPVTLVVQPAGSVIPNTTTHAEGSNILGSDGTIYRIMSGARYPYTSAGDFISYRFNTWAGVQAANAADMALPIPTYTPNSSSAPVTAFIPPRNGSLINDHGTIYIISEGQRQGFSSAQTFLSLGYSFANTLPGDTSFLQSLSPVNSDQIPHPPGTIVNDTGTVCVMKLDGRHCFTNLSNMFSWGIELNDIVKANRYDHVTPMTATISARTAAGILNP